MRTIILLLSLSCVLNFSYAQEKLTQEEQAKRERNIQAGNPFKKFGYKPKISTLSNGKYLEFHDLDSIVEIGSFTFHVKNKIITGYIQVETKYSEATLRPELVSRWFSPDPLSDEFPSWSPYNFVMNNPIRYIDPLGLAPVDILDDPGDKFKTKQAAAKDFAQQYNGISIINNVELKATFYSFSEGGDTFYSYTVPEGYISTDENGNNISDGIAGEPLPAPEGTNLVADAHTHAHDRAGRVAKKQAMFYNDNVPSDQDKQSTRDTAKNVKNYSSFVATPNGTLFEYDPYVKGEPKPVKGQRSLIKISTSIPSDPKSPTRKNKVSPNVVPNVMPKVYVNGELNPALLKTKFN